MASRASNEFQMPGEAMTTKIKVKMPGKVMTTEIKMPTEVTTKIKMAKVEIKFHCYRSVHN